MKNNYLKLCAWCGPVFILLFFVGYAFLAGFFPPPDPAASAGEIAAMYREQGFALRMGLVLMMVALAFLVPFLAAITVQMKNMGNYSPALLVTFVIASATVMAIFYIIVCAWGVASFRADRAADIVQAFSDFGFIMMIWPVSILPVSYIALGLATLSDTREQPVFPRWFGFANFWLAVLAYGGALLIFFQAGPFAWDGLIAFWVPAFAFFGWYIMTAVVLLRSLGIEHEEVALEEVELEEVELEGVGLERA